MTTGYEKDIRFLVTAEYEMLHFTLAFLMNTLYYGDNLKILREHIATESVDLIYLDPPFNSNRNYDVLLKTKAASKPIRKSRPSTTREDGRIK